MWNLWTIYLLLWYISVIIFELRYIIFRMGSCASTCWYHVGNTSLTQCVYTCHNWDTSSFCLHDYPVSCGMCSISYLKYLVEIFKGNKLVLFLTMNIKLIFSIFFNFTHEATLPNQASPPNYPSFTTQGPLTCLRTSAVWAFMSDPFRRLNPESW